MNDKTIQELRSWMDRFQNGGEDTNAMMEEYFSILSRAEQEAKEEPLAVLANSNGFSMRIGSTEKGVWFISLRRGHNTRKQISADTYATAEAKARAYLAGLPDKEDGK